MTEIRRALFTAQNRAATTDTGTATVTGYASVFGSRNSYGEVFVPGAFADTIAAVSDAKPLPMLWQHREPIGRWTGMTEDEIGLRLDGEISDTAAGRDASTLLRDGAVTGLSIGFWPEDVLAAEPGETVVLDTPAGRVSYRQDKWTYYVLKASLVETSIVHAPSDDEARTLLVRSASIPVDRAAVALPGLRADAPWEDVAWSMALLMGGKGAGHLADLAPAERQALHARLAAAYERHDRTPPEYAERPDFQTVTFAHDERELFRDRYLGKRLADVIAGANGLDRPLSDETKDRALQARAAIDALLGVDAEPPTDPNAALLAVLDGALAQINPES